jgi:SAM-dependent methyltransferase
LLLASIAAAREARVPSEIIDELLAPVHEEMKKSAFYQRTHTWPRGYPGDFETIEMLCYPQRYAKEERSLADWTQEIALRHPSVQQHRNKILKQALIILETVLDATADTRILSAGCGGCADLRLVLPLLRKFPGRFVLVDSDEDALAFSRQELGALAAACDFVKLNAIRYVRYAERHGEKFDLVYAGGLLDYFTDDRLVFFIGGAYSLVKPGGRLFFTNLAEANLQVDLIKHFARWELFLRSEEAVLGLCQRAGIDPSLVQIERDASGIALLVDIKKH